MRIMPSVQPANASCYHTPSRDLIPLQSTYPRGHYLKAEAQTRRFAASCHGSVGGSGPGAADDDASDFTYAPEDERVIILVRGSSTIHKGGGASLRALRGPAIQHKVRAALADAAMVGRIQSRRHPDSEESATVVTLTLPTHDPNITRDHLL
jgi:hypothetical protein